MTSSNINLNQAPIVNPGGNYVDDWRRLPSSLLLTARERDVLARVLGRVGNDFLRRVYSGSHKDVYDARVIVDKMFYKLTHEEE